jgi:hypothetical protein
MLSAIRRFVVFLLGSACLTGGWAVMAADKAEPPLFLRVQRDERKNPLSLETAVVRYLAPGESPDSPRYVDLVGAVHIGERTYYDGLNQLFRDYEAVLYELVASPEANVPQPGIRSGHPVGLLQVTMKNLLELEFQLDCVQYNKPNFVHADLSPDEFHKSMAHRDESFSKMFFRLMGQGLAQQSRDPGRTNELAVFSALLSKERAIELKRAMAQQFEEMESVTLAFDGPKGSAIISDRNQRALEVLDAQRKSGKQRVAIFYGAAHLPDFDRRLRELGYTSTSTRWLVAWNLQPVREKPSQRQLTPSRSK